MQKLLILLVVIFAVHISHGQTTDIVKLNEADIYYAAITPLV